MPTDLDEVLAGATSDPAPVDVDGLWSAGRRRRRRRHVASAAGGLASIAVVAVAISALGFAGPTATPEVSPLGETDEADQGTSDETDGSDETMPDDGVELEVPAAPSDPPDPEDQAPGPNDGTDGVGDADETTSDDVQAQDQQEPAGGSEPTPDGAAMADPCAPHDAADLQVFIDVVSPVAGQSVDGAVDLVGCSRVSEGTVRYRVLDGSGQVLVDSFTTAAAGGPELGEFRETIGVDAAGDLILEVFWDSPADGEGERDLVRVPIRVS